MSENKIENKIERKLKDCDICASEKIENLFVSCKCKLSACLNCVMKFLLGDNDINPKCMNCKIVYTFDFIRDTFGSVFDEKYRTHRCKIIQEREKSLLPQAQEILTNKRKLDSLNNDHKNIDLSIDKIKIKKRELLNKIKSLKQKYKEEKDNSLKIEIEIFQKKINKYIYNINERINLKTIIHEKQKELRQIVDYKNNKEEKKSVGFQGHCPEDNCKGYLDNKGVCGLCDKKACKSCKQKNHEGDCDKDILETVKMLAKDTKNCPACNIPISKISGCDQMYCVSCHTAFSWNTGKIETGRIHNPHYYEIKRNNNDTIREAADVRCGGAVNWFSLENILFRIKNNISHSGLNGFELDKMHKILFTSHRFSGHVRGFLLTTVYNYYTGGMDNIDLRLRYLSELDFTPDKWLKMLRMREKAREKKNVMHGIFRMFTDVVDELHANIVELDKKSLLTLDEFKNIINEIENLRKHTNSLIRKVGKQFKNKVFIIDSNFKEQSE